METIKLSNSEMRFMELVWDDSPINSTELVKLAHAKLGWKKSTTYTVLRRLGEKAIIKSESATVSPLVMREEVHQVQSEELLGRVYEGSIKVFLASFLQREKITEQEAKELKKMIDEYTTKEE